VSLSLENAVLTANRAFYVAFAERDAGTMSRLWAREHAVACIHPGRSAVHGRDAVLASWRAILDSPQAPAIQCTEAAAVVLGDVAFVTCVEHIGEAKVAATNVFALEHGEWRLVHHHAGLMVPPRESRRPSTNSLN
jgi:ketosteroid isomerase-like protein